MQAERLRKGGTIGIFCPSHVADMKRYAQTARALERLGLCGEVREERLPG